MDIDILYPEEITAPLNQSGIVIASLVVVNLIDTILLVGNKSGFTSWLFSPVKYAMY